MEGRGFVLVGLAHSKGRRRRRRRCYKVCCCCFCRHENGELLTQWRPLNRAARARPDVVVDGARERGLEGVNERGGQFARSFVNLVLE